MSPRFHLLAALAAGVFPIGAAAHCPAPFLEAPAAWGKPVASNSNGVLAYQPVGLTLFDRKVSYVYIDGEGTEVHFRLAGETRRAGQPLSRSLRDAFQRAYPNGDCVREYGGGSCSDYSMSAKRAGGLTEVSLEFGSPPGDWSGASAGPIQADARLGDGDAPVFALCSYRGDDD